MAEPLTAIFAEQCGLTDFLFRGGIEANFQ